MEHRAVVSALAELERLMPTLQGEARARLVRAEARLRAVLANRCSTAAGCIGCPGACASTRDLALVPYSAPSETTASS